MAIWKQLLIAAVLLVAAAFAWLRFFPGADATLASWGIEWARAAVPKTASAPLQGDKPRQSGRVPSVIAAPVVEAVINDRLSAIGTGQAAASVSVKPYSAGRITEILVEPGAEVRKGDVLARLESDTEQLAVERARIALDDAVARSRRLKSLRSSNAATDVQVTDAELLENTARLALREAELALERRDIIAPISGIVGILPVEAGNYVTSDTEVAMIDDRSSIVVKFWVPERYAAAITVGAPVTATSIARPNEVLQGTVRAVDSRLDEASRTLLVEARLANPDDTLRPGMSFRVSMQFPGDRYPAVDPLAVQWGTDGAFVWVVDNATARRVPVRIIQRNTENVLVAGDIDVGDHVVTEGIHLVREGAELLVGTRAGSAIPGQAASADAAEGAPAPVRQ